MHAEVLELAPAQAPSSSEIAIDFGRAALQSGVIDPLWNGVGQLVSLGHLPQVDIVRHENAALSKTDYWAQELGRGVGAAVEAVALYKVLRLPLPFDQMELPFGERVLRGGINAAAVGTIMGTVFTPSEKTQTAADLLAGRIENGFLGGLTFGIAGSIAGMVPALPIASDIERAL